MKLTTLLARRRALREQALLSNLAFALKHLTEIVGRIERARLHGQVRLLQAAPEEDRLENTLLAEQGSQSVIEEHFTDRDIDDFVDAVGYATGEAFVDEVFDLREVDARFLQPVRRKLEDYEVDIDLPEATRNPRSVNEGE